MVLDPHRRFGQPIIDEAGVGTEVLAGVAEAEGSIEAAAYWYKVSEQARRDRIEAEDYARRSAEASYVNRQLDRTAKLLECLEWHSRNRVARDACRARVLVETIPRATP